jgi:hypothetical protein
MPHFKRPTPYEVELTAAALTLAGKIMDAAERACMKDAGGDGEVFEQGGKSIGHDGLSV